MIRNSVIATLASLALAGVASAADSVVIDIAEVDFDDPAQATAVYEKIVDASEKVCRDLHYGSMSSYGSLLTQRRFYAECVTKTVSDTIADVAQPALTSEHAARDVDAFTVASQ